MQRDSAGRSCGGNVTRALLFLLLLVLVACSDEKPRKQTISEMIESPVQNTVISSFDHYPPRPADSSEDSNEK
jgi:hypothetical protein